MTARIDPGFLAYPTGLAVIDELTEFAARRLPAILGPVPAAHNERPSLAEDRWVERHEAAGRVFPVHGLRACYRWARNRNIYEGLSGREMHLRSEDAANLLLHQQSELLPMLFHAAQTVGLQQQCDSFNARCSIGQAVSVRKDDGSTIETVTRSAAEVLSGHTAVIWLAGVSGCYLLDRVTPIEARA